MSDNRSENSLQGAQETQGAYIDSISGIDQGGAEKVPKTASRKRWSSGVVVFLVFLVMIGAGFSVAGMILWSQERAQRIELENLEPVEKVIEKIEVVKEGGNVITVETENLGKNEREVREVVTEVRKKIDEWAEVKDAYDEMRSPVIYTVYDGYTTLFYQVDETEIIVPLDRSYGLMLGYLSGWGRTTVEKMQNIVRSKEMRDKLMSFLEERGFRRYEAVQEIYFAENEMINDETGVICHLGSGSEALDFACSHVSWVNAEELAFANELLTGNVEEILWESADGERRKAKVIDVHGAKIKESVITPYQTVRVETAGGFLDFYREGEEGRWKFLAETQGDADCKVYDTLEKRKAFAGVVCYDGEELKKVEISE